MSERSAAEQLEITRTELAAAQERLKALEERQAKAIESVEEFENWHGDHRRTTLEVQRLSKVLAVLEHEVVHERRQQLLAKAEAQTRANEDLAERLRKEGAAVVQQLQGLLRDVAQADIATAKINAMLPADAPPIKTTDTIARAREMRPREDISEKQVELWVSAESGAPIPDQTSVSDHGNGVGTVPSASSTGVHKCARRRYRLIEYYDEEPVQRVEPLIKALRLPHFDRPGIAWDGDHVGGPQAALDLLDREDPEPKRQLLKQLVPEAPWVRPIVSLSSPKAEKTTARRT